MPRPAMGCCARKKKLLLVEENQVLVSKTALPEKSFHLSRTQCDCIAFLVMSLIALRRTFSIMQFIILILSN